MQLEDCSDDATIKSVKIEQDGKNSGVFFESSDYLAQLQAKFDKLVKSSRRPCKMPRLTQFIQRILYGRLCD